MIIMSFIIIDDAAILKRGVVPARQGRPFVPTRSDLKKQSSFHQSNFIHTYAWIVQLKLNVGLLSNSNSREITNM